MFTPPFILSIAGGGSTYTPGIVKSLMVRLQDFPLAEIRLYDNLFTVEDPDAGDFLELLNPDSLKVLTGCKVEAGLKTAKPGESFQFMRQGYFCVDNKDSAEDHLVFNRSVSLKDGFKKKK